MSFQSFIVAKLKFHYISISWVAAAIGPLRMPPEDAIAALLRLAENVFPGITSGNNDNEKINRISALRAFLEDLLETRGLTKEVEMKQIERGGCKL
jgi:hypothetical protein